MTQNPNIMLSILAMDSYNRGYNAGILELPTGADSKIGSASISIDSGIIQSAGDRLDDDIGFYAVAYEVGGSTIISYRGTDDVKTSSDITNSLDVYHGWSLGLGESDSQQGQMANDNLPTKRKIAA